MATIDELLAGQVPTENDLLADNPWYMAGRQIQGMQAPQPQNNTQALLLPMLQGLAGGGLMGYGKGQAYEAGYDQYRNNPLLKAMVGSDTVGADGQAPLIPYASETMPENWTPKIGKTDLLQALSAKQIMDEAAAKKADFESQVDAQIRLKTDPRILEAEGMKLSADIQKDKAKNLRDDEDTTYKRITALPEATKLAELEPHVKLATNLVNKDDKASAQAFTKAIIKIQDPTSVVSSTELKVAGDVLPFLEKHLGSNWRSIAQGKAELSPTARKAMLAAVLPAYNATGSAYEEKKGRILDIFEQAKGGSRANIPVSTWKPIDLGASTGGSPPPGMKMQRNKKTGETRFVPL
jgi:hypothetical protein